MHIDFHLKGMTLSYFDIAHLFLSPFLCTILKKQKKLKKADLFRSSWKFHVPRVFRQKCCLQTLLIKKGRCGSRSTRTKYCLSDDMFTKVESKTRRLGNKNNVRVPKVVLSRLRDNSFKYPSCKLWNLAPIEVTTAPTLAKAKDEIRKFVKSLPKWCDRCDMSQNNR